MKILIGDQEGFYSDQELEQQGYAEISDEFGNIFGCIYDNDDDPPEIEIYPTQEE